MVFLPAVLGILWIRGSKVGFRSGGLTSFATLGGKTQKWKMDSVVIFANRWEFQIFLKMGISDFFEDGNLRFFVVSRFCEVI